MTTPKTGRKRNSSIPWEKIDEPIRNIIRQMNEVGFKTVHSCAGYNYEGHIADNQITQGVKEVAMPYVTFRGSIKKVRRFYDIVSEYDWKIELDRNNKFYLYFIPARRFKNHQLSRLSWNAIREGLIQLRKSHDV